MSPLVPIALGYATWNVVCDGASAYADTPRSAGLLAAAHHSSRVVWIIFDEWDYALSFVNRPDAARLSEIDLFRQHAFDATQVLPPSTHTILSVPSLLTGNIVVKTDGVSPHELRLTFANSSRPALFSACSIFSSAAAEGFRTAVAGWYLPYCRVLKDDLSLCTWCDHDNFPDRIPDRDSTVRRFLADQTRAMFETSRFSLFASTLAMEKHERSYRTILRSATAYVADPSLDLVFLHFDIPHAPTIPGENPASRHNPAQWYADNLSLLDRTWAQLRRSMEAAGTWQNTTVLLSSDHFLRAARNGNVKPDRRIPFLLHFAGQEQAATSDFPFNSVISHDLVLAILRGQVTSVTSLGDWLQSRPPSSGVHLPTFLGHP